MHRSMLRRLIVTDFENLLDALATRQHLSPHEPLGQTLAAVTKQLGVCPQAVDQAVTWLNMDRTTSVGRLRRTELVQLARSLHRFWRQNAASAPQSPAANPS